MKRAGSFGIAGPVEFPKSLQSTFSIASLSIERAGVMIPNLKLLYSLMRFVCHKDENTRITQGRCTI